MDSGSEDDSAPDCDLLRATEEVCNDYHLAIVARNGFSQDGLSDLVLCLIGAKPLQ